MTSLKNNPIIDQFRIVLSKAIDLKEQFDLQKPIEILFEYAKLYAAELDKLVRISPSEIFQKTHLLRHSGWIQRYLSKGQPQNCYGDIQEICHTDLYLTEEYYFHFLADNNEVPEKYYDWQNINPVIRNLARSRFESTHYADAVEASFKEINDIVKKKHFDLTGNELDGVPLMRRVFTSTANNNYAPLVPLTPNSNESERNVQEGYMNILVGAMQGIRNPTAHANLNIHPDESWEMIVLASHLLNRISDKL